MKTTRYLITAALAVALMAASGFADGKRAVDKLQYPKLNPLEIPKVTTQKLSNGIPVYVLEDHTLPTFNFSIRIAAGGYLEDADKVGLTDILSETIRTGGTQKWTGDEIDEELEGVGATVESNMGITSGSIFGNSLIEYSDLILEVASQMLMHPTYDQDKIDITKTQIRGSISRRNDDPQGVASRIFSAAIYGEDSPYARWAEYSTIDNVSREDLLAFHKMWIHPKNLQISAWGDFNQADMLAKLEKMFGSWKADGEVAPPPPKVDSLQGNRIKYVEKNDVNQSNIYIGHLGGMVKDSDYATRLVMNNIFGGGFGSRLFSNVRTREGLAYATGGGFNANVDYPGRFFGFASTKSGTTVKAMKEIEKQMESMKTTPPNKEEMDVAVDGYLNSYVFNFDTRGEVINRMMQYDANGLPMDFLAQVKDKVEKVSPSDVQAAAQKHFDTDNLMMVVVGKGSDFDEPLTSLGLPVDTVDITIPSGEESKDMDMSAENVEKGKKILASAIEACGGESAFGKIKAVSTTSSLTMNAGGQSMTLNSTSLISAPDKSRRTVKTPMGEMNVIFNGSQGWRVMGGQVQPMAEQEIEASRQEVMRDLTLLFAGNGADMYTPVYVGSGEVNGSSVDKVALVDNEGSSLMEISVDAQSHLPVAKSYFGNTAAGPANITVYYSDFREVSGIKTPFSAKAESNGQTVMENSISEYKVNPDVPADSFNEPQG